MQQWKNFENRSVFGKDMGEILWLTFLGHLYMHNRIFNFWVLTPLLYKKCTKKFSASGASPLPHQGLCPWPRWGIGWCSTHSPLSGRHLAKCWICPWSILCTMRIYTVLHSFVWVYRLLKLHDLVDIGIATYSRQLINRIRLLDDSPRNRRRSPTPPPIS